MTYLKKAAITALVLAVILMAGSMLWNWFHPASSPTQQVITQYAPAQPIKETVKIQKVEVPGPTKIVTIEKPVIVEKLKLPDEIAKDPDKQITATAEVPPYEGETHAIAILDTKTGEGSISIKQEPLPFFQFMNEKEVGLSGRGVADKDGLTQEVALDGRWTFVRIGPVRAALTVEMTSRPEGKAGLRLYTRW